MNTARPYLVLVFLAIATFSFGGKASAQAAPYLYPSFHIEGSPSTLVVNCNDFTAWRVYYWLDRTPPLSLDTKSLIVLSPDGTGTAAPPNAPADMYTALSQTDNGSTAPQCFGAAALNLGMLSQGPHKIYIFLYTRMVYGKNFYGPLFQQLFWGYLTADIYVCTANYGSSCSSSPNTCGGISYGTIQCDGSCSAGPPPPNPSYYGTSCTSSPNACGGTASGTLDCNGVCSATPPALPAGYGTVCTSSPNACGQTTSGVTDCSGTCSAAVPPNPPSYNTSCPLTSLPNACGETTTVVNAGTVSCSGTCTGTPPPPPSNASCAPTAPTVSGLYKSGIYQGPTAPAYAPQGYQLSAQATSPANFPLTYYFEWSKDGITWTGDPNLPVGSWAGQ